MTVHEIGKPAQRHCPRRRKNREAGTEQVFVQKEAGPGEEKGGPGLSAWSPSSGPRQLDRVYRMHTELLVREVGHRHSWRKMHDE